MANTGLFKEIEGKLMILKEASKIRMSVYQPIIFFLSEHKGGKCVYYKAYEQFISFGYFYITHGDF